MAFTKEMVVMCFCFLDGQYEEVACCYRAEDAFFTLTSSAMKTFTWKIVRLKGCTV